MIISAAVIIEKEGKKIIIPCHRHGDAYTILHRLDIPQNSYKIVEQGFIAYEVDPDGPFNVTETFLNRKEALSHAKMSRQILSSMSDDELYSEDLW